MSFLKPFFTRNISRSVPKLSQSILPTTSIIPKRNITVKKLTTPELCFEAIKAKDPWQTEFIQAVDEVIVSCKPLFDKYPDYIHVLPIMAEPERIIQFRVTWNDDEGHTHVNRGYRVQFSQVLGPYKGGLRFHPSVNKSIMKFLGFEQCFKNALTGIPLGGGKGGSDFDPKNKTNSEVLRFCAGFMSELYRHIGPHSDIPAGDVGVGAREIGYLFGEYKRITSRHDGVLTGKGDTWGGSKIRPEATGYGVIYIMDIALRDINETFANKRCVISGSGNVAEYTAEKIMQLGGVVLSFSDSNGSIIEDNGFSEKQINILRDIKKKRGRCKDYLKHSKTARYIENDTPWKYVKNVDCAFPSATQNEINKDDALALVNNGCKYVAEGANMPSDKDAIDVFQEHCEIYIPAKASNAGGVGCSGLEMAQNAQHLYWTRDEVDNQLKKMMQHIYDVSKETADDLGKPNDFLLGANAYSYKLIANAMFDYGQPLKSWEPVIEPQNLKI